MKRAIIRSGLRLVSSAIVLCLIASPSLAQQAEQAAIAPLPVPSAADPGSPPASAVAPAPLPYSEPARAVEPPPPTPLYAAPVASAPAPAVPPAYPAPPAAAATNGPITSDQAAPASKDTPIGERTGFYFQAALGAGFVSIEDEYEGPYSGTETVKGPGTLASLRFGGGVGSGFVLGAGIESVSGTFDYEDQWEGEAADTTETEVEASGGAAFVLAQKYLGPVFLRAEVGGMWGGSKGEEELDYGGLMIAGGLGLDFLVSDSWSLGGVLGVRHTAGSYDDDDGYSGDYTMTLSSLQITATYY